MKKDYREAIAIITKHHALPFAISDSVAKADIESLTRKGKDNKLTKDDLELTVKLYDAGYIDLTGFDCFAPR